MGHSMSENQELKCSTGCGHILDIPKASVRAVYRRRGAKQLFPPEVIFVEVVAILLLWTNMSSDLTLTYTSWVCFVKVLTS